MPRSVAGISYLRSPFYGEGGKPDAALYYTYYERSDVQVRSRRPPFISLHGGADHAPGAGPEPSRPRLAAPSACVAGSSPAASSVGSRTRVI